LIGASGLPVTRGGYAPEALRAAIYFLSAASSLAEALSLSIRFAGRANYCPVLVGAIGGARWGASQVPAELLKGRGILPRVEQVSDKLASSWLTEAGY